MSGTTFPAMRRLKTHREIKHFLYGIQNRDVCYRCGECIKYHLLTKDQIVPTA